jgi:hypothetical protein
MNTMLISYDLKSPGRDYENLWKHLRSYPDYRKPLESFWLVKTSSNHKTIWDETAKHIDSNDKLMVIDVTKDGAKWRISDDEVSQWIKNNL